MSVLPEKAGLPAIAEARLPGTYVAAKRALAALGRIDLCKVWADKAAALAAYARMARDDELEMQARRLRAWALRRAGELLAEIAPAANQHDAAKRASAGAHTSRSAAANEAGLSHHQQAAALRIAEIPAKEFEAMVEAPRPATIERLDERARQRRGEPSAFMEEAAQRRAAKQPAEPPPPISSRWPARPPAPQIDLAGRTPAQFRAATNLKGYLPLLIEDLKDIDAEAVRPGLDGADLGTIAAQLREIRTLLDKIEQGLGLCVDV
jgi:hypothetical protein